MATATTAVSTQREPELLGQTVVVIGGSAGIGLETARIVHNKQEFVSTLARRSYAPRTRPTRDISDRMGSRTTERPFGDSTGL